MTDVRIIGTGAYVPDRIVSNDEVGAAAGVDDAWITRKTAIRERRWAAPARPPRTWPRRRHGPR